MIAGNLNIKHKFASWISFILTFLIWSDGISAGQPKLSVLSKSGVTCSNANDGKVELKVTSGKSPFLFKISGQSYQSSKKFDSLAPGNYSFVVMDDDNELDSISVNIADANKFVLTSTLVQPRCNNSANGSIALSLTGGVGGYSYQWSNSAGYTSKSKNISGLVTGSYKVEISDGNGCNFDTTYNVSSVNFLSAKVSKGDIKCFGNSDGLAKLNIVSSIGLFQIAWTGPNNYTSSSFIISNLSQGVYNVIVTDTANCTVSASVSINMPAQLSITIKSVKDALCYGTANGTVVTEVNGGRKPYTFSWSGPNSYVSSNQNIYDAPYGLLQVSISDSSGCSANNQAFISEPSQLVASSKITDVTCFGLSNGKIEQTVSGGSKPYSFSWVSGIKTKDLTKISSGNYTVIISDSNGCFLSKTYSVSAPQNLELAYVSTNVKCHTQKNGSFTLFGSGGTFPWTYSVNGPSAYSSTSVTNKNLGAGNYKVKLTDAKGCKDSQIIVISQPLAISVGKKVIQPTCFGLKGSLSLNVNGGTSPYSYEWLDNSGALYAATQNVVSADIGNYTFTVIDANQCSYSDTVNVYQPSQLNLSLKSKVNPVCFADSTGQIKLTTNGGIKPYSFQLNATPFQSDSSYNKLIKGVYSISVRDKNYCSDTINYYLKYLDTVKPSMSLKKPTIYLSNSGSVSVQLTQLDSGITDNCEVSSISISKTTFNCSQLGSNLITVTASDLSGNTIVKNTTITVKDTVKPVIVSQSANVYLNTSGFASLTTSTVNKGSYDNCKLDSVTINKSTFNCTNLGVNQIVLRVKDNSGNQSLQYVTVNVLDTVKPIINYKNVNCYLNSSGIGKISEQDVNNGSYDNCAIVSYSLSQQVFDCNEMGTNFITFSIKDKAGNLTSQSVKVTVIDTINPVIKIKNVSLYLNQYGYSVLSPSDLDDGSFDNCKIASKSISKSVFTCGNLGSNIIVYTVSDPSGNSSQVNVSLTVYDTIKPTNKTRNTSVYLDNNGFAVLSLYDVDNGSFDNCGISKYALSRDRFYCYELGKKSVSFTTSDQSGNTTVNSVDITVLDTVRPIIKTANKNIYLDKSGQFSIDASYFDNGSYDNCGIKTRTLSQYNFNCTDVGNKLLLYSITDTSGNSAIAIVNVKVFDTISPIVIAQNKTVYLDSLGKVKLSKDVFASLCSDNCEIQNLYLTDSIFDCSKIGTRIVSLVALDKSGNLSAQQFSVIVKDTIRPKILVKDAVIYIDTAGFANLTAKDFVVSAQDNCTIKAINFTQSQFTNLEIGENWIEASIVDGVGNKSANQWVKVIVELGDADKDSIPDYVERALDFDQDGVPNYLDKDSDNDGVLDLDENDGLDILLDLDRDGYANVYDLDSDNDRILDIIENNGYDPDRNGRVGLGKVSVAFNGVPVLANNASGYLLVFTDSDLFPDYKDLDSDGDLISDKVENGPTDQPLDFDNDGTLDFRDLDSDNDLISDSIETNKDFDEDGKPNYIDYDSDADGILDKIESSFDYDNDGLGSWLDLDSDNDNILDEVETSADLDKDGSGNWIDKDADNDKIPDLFETNLDFDNDRIPDFLDTDSDGDGISDEVEGQPFVSNTPADTDADGQFDFKDIDSDNDGILDEIEGRPNPSLPDSDDDGTPDFRDEDSDQDGVLDLYEGLKDTDNDGILDAIDKDSDEDGIPDKIETYSDSDGDGIPNSLDLDSDNDGVNDVRECGYNDVSGKGMVINLDSCITSDVDGDGLFNFIDTDSDGDGISDLVESGKLFSDKNFDGRVDGIDTDLDGIQDEADDLTGKFGDAYDQNQVDSDGDGTRDFEDFDSDNDKISDEIEKNIDLDYDYIPNYLDQDSDQDNIQDSIETANDFDLDGLGNWLDFDSDNDNIADSTELNFDFDGDGSPNYLDLDSDGDEVSDEIEGSVDSDRNSYKDFLDCQTFVPEVFTPNNDGVNDVLKIKGLVNFPNASIVVFNQWGQVVFKSNGPYQNNWGGINTEGSNFANNVVLPEGIYFYVLDHNQSNSTNYNRPQSKGNFYIKP